jgi:hypothetical protein
MNWLAHFPAGGGAAVNVAVNPAPGAPSGVVFDNLGNMYIGDAVNGTGGNAGRILKVAPADQASNPMPATVLCDSPLAYNSGRLAYDGAHTLLFPSSTPYTKLIAVDTVTGAIRVVTSTFAPLAENGGGALYPSGSVALDLAGDIWLSTDNVNVPTAFSGLIKLSPRGVPLKFYPYPATIGGLSTTGWRGCDVAVLGAAGARLCGGPIPTLTPTHSASPTPAPAWTATVTPTPTPTPTGWDGDGEHHRLHCWPNYSHGDEDHIGVDCRSYVGGHCSLKVLRGNNRGLCGLWDGNLDPHGTLHKDWDCRGDHGELAPSGVYYVVFTDGDGSCYTQKVLIVR